jgi:hypothetical protein
LLSGIIAQPRNSFVNLPEARPDADRSVSVREHSAVHIVNTLLCENWQ